MPPLTLPNKISAVSNAVFLTGFLFVFIATSCGPQPAPVADTAPTQDTLQSQVIIQPRVVTRPTPNDTDDPAIWINPEDVMKSLIIGTDKDINGGLYAFNLDGEMVDSVPNLKRPNNVDVAYGLNINGKPTDIVVATERFTHNLRIFSLPGFHPLDGGGLPMFEGETGTEFRDLMGIALYTPQPGEVHAIVGRKTGPVDGTYLWQYRLDALPSGQLEATLLRKFGNFSGRKEIEAIAVDNALGYIYYSDEQAGIRKYYAHPDSGNAELAFFGIQGFADDHEGISIYPVSETTGYIIVSDQQRNAFRLFPREGSNGNPHHHPEVYAVFAATTASDGNEVTRETFNGRFPGGLFVAMSDDRTFHYYAVEDLLKGKK